MGIRWRCRRRAKQTQTSMPTFTDLCRVYPIPLDFRKSARKAERTTPTRCTTPTATQRRPTRLLTVGTRLGGRLPLLAPSSRLSCARAPTACLGGWLLAAEPRHAAETLATWAFGDALGVIAGKVVPEAATVAGTEAAEAAAAARAAPEPNGGASAPGAEPTTPQAETPAAASVATPQEVSATSKPKTLAEWLKKEPRIVGRSEETVQGETSVARN